MTPFVTIRQASATYPVFVARGLIGQVGSLVDPRGAVFVITSTQLRSRFGEPVAASFPNAEILTLEEGERYKTVETATGIVTQLLERGARRDSLAVVVGGGMIGDTAGFAASIFLRGIDLVLVPTTLLAQVDSSLGGKLAVNHLLGKNLVGSFYPPRAVFADTAVLESLPSRELLSGVFESLKGGVIGDPELFAILEDGTLGDVEEVVRRAIAVKATIVAADEKEGDIRRLLNYGHTIGHGIETALHYEGLTHGEAVGWGMLAANSIAAKRGLLPATVRSRIDDSVRAWRPSSLPALDRAAVIAATEHDKKNTGTKRVMVLAREVGVCEVVTDITADEIAYGVDAVLMG